MHRAVVATIRYLTRMPQARLLSVTPSSSLIDEQVAVKATGLEANSHVTIRSVSEDRERGAVRYEGHAHYEADDKGVVSVPDQASLGGTYIGTEPMGLFWSMMLAPGQRLGARFRHEDVTKPMKVHLSLYQGHLDTDTLQTIQPDAMATAERWYLGKDVERIKVHTGRLRGILFKPKGPGPFPGVIDMFGGSGGLFENRAAMLASRGFSCYALPYFKYEDLPSQYADIELEYFKDAINWLCDQPFVKPGGIGLIGISAGVPIQLAVVSHFPEKVSAVVCVNGITVQACVPIRFNGVPVPFIPIDFRAVKTLETGAIDMFDCWKKSLEITDDDGAAFKLENAPNCQFLFVTGGKDRAWDSCYYARKAMKRLERHGCHNYQLLSYPDAGHHIEVPYAPTYDMSYMSWPKIETVVHVGGSSFGNTKAMEDSWPKILRFLRTHCGHDNTNI